MKTTLFSICLILFSINSLGAAADHFDAECFAPVIQKKHSNKCNSQCVSLLNTILDNEGASKNKCENYEYKSIVAAYDFKTLSVDFGVALRLVENHSNKLECIKAELTANLSLDADQALFNCSMPSKR